MLWIERILGCYTTKWLLIKKSVSTDHWSRHGMIYNQWMHPRVLCFLAYFSSFYPKHYNSLYFGDNHLLDLKFWIMCLLVWLVHILFENSCNPPHIVPSRATHYIRVSLTLFSNPCNISNHHFNFIFINSIFLQFYREEGY